MRAALGPLYDEFRVDLVLQGHDHAYARTHKVFDGRLAGPQAPGTVYAIVGVRARRCTPSRTGGPR